MPISTRLLLLKTCTTKQSTFPLLTHSQSTRPRLRKTTPRPSPPSTLAFPDFQPQLRCPRRSQRCKRRSLRR